MDQGRILIYDGSFNGFLTAVFVAFGEKLQVTDIQNTRTGQNKLFAETRTVITEMTKAKRVWNGIHDKSYSALKNIYFAFLSERPGIELLLYRYIRKLFSTFSDHRDNSEKIQLKISALANLVAREKDILENELRFQQTSDGLSFVHVSPAFDVLPLISKYFRAKHSRRPWIIYDEKRKYGLFYDGTSVEIISCPKALHSWSINKKDRFEESGKELEIIWNDYFRSRSANIPIFNDLYNFRLPRQFEQEQRVRKAV